jgi:uracil-DNA glycosylase family protein
MIPPDAQQPSLFDGEVSAAVDALERVRAAARDCRACPLWAIGTQTVFGAGPADARVMLIGEAPGETEDREGRPFVGRAGQLLDEGLAQAGLRRERVWVTNTVKHRPWEQQGRRQKNRAPKASEIKACLPWLEQELALLRPELVVCLGAVAAKAILGKDFKLTQQRGQWLAAPGVPLVLATLHPSYVLIQPTDSYGRTRDTLFGDLAAVAARCRELGLDAATVQR